MEGFQRELRRHIKQYGVIQGSEWKKITNHIIRQYHTIDSPPFHMGFNMQVVTGPTKAPTKYGWLCTLLEWTNIARHDLITRNLWPKPETNNNQELNKIPMHEHQWGTESNSWNTTKDTAKAKNWQDSSTKQTTPRSIYNATTADRSNISYDPYRSTHVFMKVNLDAPKPTDNVWIGTSHVFLPTFWCSKCDSWSSHHDNFMTNASDGVQLLPLPQPPLRARTDARTNPSAQRAIQLRSVLARVYAVSRQNQITTTVP
jgi:hypothetical protein